MAEKPPRKPKPLEPGAAASSDRMPSNEELLYELRKHGAKPPASRNDLPRISRRTRDYLLTAGVGSAGITFATVRLLSDSDGAVVLRLALTGIALCCGLLWFIFYGVMSRY